MCQKTTKYPGPPPDGPGSQSVAHPGTHPGKCDCSLREPNFFTFSVIFSHIASIFTFSVEFFSHLATFSHIAAFSHLRVPQTSQHECKYMLRVNMHSDMAQKTCDYNNNKLWLVFCAGQQLSWHSNIFILSAQISAR